MLVSLEHNLLAELANKVNWDQVSGNGSCTDEFLNAFKHKLNWNLVTIYATENQIRKHADCVDWETVSGYRHVSESFIREFQDRVDWRHISRFQKLSEDFIREFQDKVDWENIFKNQIVSKEFVEEFGNKVKWMTINVDECVSSEVVASVIYNKN